MKNPYDDIIDLPRPISATRLPMSIANRAAQFAPFAALTGHGDAIKETARTTDKRKELSENDIEEIEAKLCIIEDMLDEYPEIYVTYFKPDGKKQGGAYVTIVGNIKRIDEYEQFLLFTDGRKIFLEDISDIGLQADNN